MYSMWKIMCFFNLKPHKHIALHQIHQIMFFLATSYDPFKDKLWESSANWNLMYCAKVCSLCVFCTWMTLCMDWKCSRFSCVCRRCTAVIRWPVRRVRSISAGCVWELSAGSTPTVTSTTPTRPALTSEYRLQRALTCVSETLHGVTRTWVFYS